MKSIIFFFSFLMLATGLLYPLAVTFVGGMFYPKESHGQIFKDREGKARGSFLIAQSFSQDQYFHPRPSSINYEAKSSGASQWSMRDSRMHDFIKNQKALGETSEEMLTQSGSGLDPEISLGEAMKQSERVARSLNVNINVVQQLINKNIVQGGLASFSPERINVMKINFEIFKMLSER